MHHNRKRLRKGVLHTYNIQAVVRVVIHYYRFINVMFHVCVIPDRVCGCNATPFRT